MYLCCTVLFCLLVPPVGYDIDCSTWPGGVTAEVEFEAVAFDGTRTKFTVTIAPAATSDSARDCFQKCFKDESWVTINLGDDCVRITGTKQSPPLFLTATSKKWAPTIKRVPYPTK
jgi:hypothetical protein